MELTDRHPEPQPDSGDSPANPEDPADLEFDAAAAADPAYDGPIPAQPSPKAGVSKDMATAVIQQRVFSAPHIPEAQLTGFVSDYSQLDDAVIMMRVRDGDISGYEYLMQKYRRPVMHFLYRMVHNQAVAEELAQEVFLRVYRARATYRAEARFTTWMYRIATNLAVNHARDTKYESAAHNVYLDEPDSESGTRPDVADDTPNIEHDLVQTEKFRAIRAQVDALPERQRTAVLMHKFQGLDYREIGRVLKLSESATKSLLFRAYQTLRDKLKDFA